MSAEALRGIRSPGARGQDQNLVKKKQHNLINVFMYKYLVNNIELYFAVFIFTVRKKHADFFIIRKNYSKLHSY